MLQHLSIENYALIRSLDADFAEGFCVITGETGAGKSILLGALGLVLGQRADSGILFDKNRKCIIEAHFDVKGLDLSRFTGRMDSAGDRERELEESETDSAVFDLEDNELILRREVLPSGKSRAFVNDTPVNLSILKELSAVLIDIHSQHQTLTLNTSAFQLKLLDSYLQDSTIIKRYQAVYEDYVLCRQKVENMEGNLAQWQQEQDYWRFLLDELDKFSPKAGEQEEMEQVLERLSHEELLKETLSETVMALNGDECSLRSRLESVVRGLKKISSYHKGVSESMGRWNSLVVELSDLSSDIERWAEEDETDPAMKERYEERLDELYRLERKHHVDDVEGLISLQQELGRKLGRVEQSSDALAAAKKELEKYSHSLEQLVEEKTADIISTNAKLSGIITHCADGIIIIDKNGTIEQVNPAVENLTGLSSERLCGNDITEFVYHKKGSVKSFLDTEKNEIFVRNCFTTNPLSSFHTPVEISFAKFNNEHYVCVLRDVGEQKKADRLRDDFMATLTHDLRTPLLAAIQTLKFFLDGSLGAITDRQKLLISTMLKSNEDLLGLVNALLEVFRYDAEKLVLQKTDFIFNELAMQIYNELKPLADKKELEFCFENTDEDLMINADKTELRRVICNLCGNAINYTQSGGKVTLIIKAEGNDLIFSVADNGSGIPQEDIPNLFQRFSQGTSAKRSTGTGLGLYLSRQIIEAHNGKIWLDTMLNKGSEFSFLLTDVITKRIKRKSGAAV